MKRCPQCGRTYEDSVLTCECGYDLQAVSPEAQEVQVQPPQAQARPKGGSLLGLGVTVLILGIIALLLPLIGYELMLFRLIPTGDPIFGGVIVAIGVVLIAVSLVIRRA